MKKKNERMILIGIALMLILLKQFLISNLPIAARTYRTDDRLMIDMAGALRRGEWLGDYKGQLLMKGAFFPMLLAVINKMGLDYLGALNILNALAAFFFVSQLRGSLKKPVFRFILFIVLLFDPCTFGRDSFQRVYRSSITEMQVLLLWGAYYGIYCKSPETEERFQLRELLLILLAGFVLWAMWNTREDCIWVLPFVIMATILIGNRYREAVRGKKCSKRTAWLRCGSLLIPVIMLLAGNQIIVSLNNRYYGEPVRLEEADGAFAKALKSIYAVKNRQEISNVTVTREKLERIMAVSPTLEQICPELDTELDRYDQKSDRHNNDGEVEDGWFFWALKYAAFNNGAAESLPKSQAYWNQVHQEVETALRDPSSSLERQAVMPSALISPLRINCLKVFPETIIKALIYMVRYRDIDTLAGSSGKSNHGNDRLFETMTNNIAISSNEEADAAKKLPYLSAAVKWLTMIRDLYRIITPAAAAAGLICFFIMLFRLTVKKQSGLLPPCLIISGMAFSMLLSVSGVCYTHISAFDALKYHYLSGAYPLMLGSIWFPILYMAQTGTVEKRGAEPYESD